MSPNWPRVALSEIAEIFSGGTPSRADPTLWNGSIPWFSPKDFKSTHLHDSEEHLSQSAFSGGKIRLHPCDTVVIVVRGMILARKVPIAITKKPGAINQDIKALRPCKEVLPNFLNLALQAQASGLHAAVSTAAHGTKKIDLADLLGTMIPLPPLDEQRRIVEVLERAAGIRRLREEALAKARALLPALFLQTFGDPATNPKGWPVRPLRELILGFEGGKNLAGGAESTSQLRILKISAVTSGEFRPKENKPAPVGYRPPESHFVRKNDLLISRANTADLVGAVAFVEQEPSNLLLPDKLWRFVWKEKLLVLPTFIAAYFRTVRVRRELRLMATGTSDSMRNISQRKLLTLPVPLPPLALQRAFAERVGEVRGIVAQQETSLEAARSLERSLMARLLG